MRKLILIFINMLLGCLCWCQENDSLNSKLDLLRAPSSPAANLLEFATSDIEKPSDVSSFMLSLQSATTGFTKLPANYAVDLAPFWLLRKGNFTTDRLNSTLFGEVFKQSFVISFGYRNPDSTETNFNTKNSYTSIGFKFSFARGHFDPNTQDALTKIGEIQSRILKLYHDATLSFEKNDPEYIRLKKQRDSLAKIYGTNAPGHPDFVSAAAALTARHKELLVSQKETFQSLDAYNKDLKELQSLASKFKITRLGFFCDLAGGTSLEFVDKIFDKTNVYNAGAWVTFGNNSQKGWGTYGIVRYLYNPNKIFADDNDQLKRANISTLDAGGRILYSNPDSRFTFSVEAIYRSVLNKNVIAPSWKLVTNAAYDLPNNQKLTLTFGRNFDGTITKDGNVITALTFLTGFGNKR